MYDGMLFAFVVYYTTMSVPALLRGYHQAEKKCVNSCNASPVSELKLVYKRINLILS